MTSRQYLKVYVLSLWFGLGLFVTGVHAQSGSLEPPGSAVNESGDPVSTMKSLDRIPPTWSQLLSCATPADCPRFDVLSRVVINGNVVSIDEWGVLDKNTGLVWEQSPQSTLHTWAEARRKCLRRNVGGQKGWRLPSVHELASLVDPTNPGGDPDLPAGHPFSNVLAADYWSATTNGENPTRAWAGTFFFGDVGHSDKTSTRIVWCVRGGGPLSEY